MKAAYGAVSIVLFMILAGCSGGGDDGSASELTPADTAEAGDGLGSISGLVVDGETLAVPGVDVAIISAGDATKTDADGKFTFNGLEPGSYQVAVQKLGYGSMAKSVAVVADEVTQVEFTIQQIDVTEPFMTVEIGDGLLTCAIGFPVVTVYPNAVGNACGEILMLEDKRAISFFLAPGLEESFSEIVWEPTNTIFGSALRSVNSVDDDDLGAVSGNSVLTVHEDGYDDDIDEESEFTHFFWAAWGSVNTDNPTHSVNVIHEQRITIYFSEFYHQEMAEGYTAVEA